MALLGIIYTQNLPQAKIFFKNPLFASQSYKNLHYLTERFIIGAQDWEAREVSAQLAGFLFFINQSALKFL
ncbi:hypothetical protein A2W70_00100 [Candidatus Curtissbacteria bacterium RIFCSPLOWO2_02_41_11]|uniref:Uncharacterized protein n=1 Tax=Candidatus Curtissbacteria bacterium RIFCSPLOWO2_02_41_11 TaxID=1797731 RepID=A0A1F5HQM4_9BACT|nr:MAG: hypothetical protein A2W70_00100 [Candidatus Curtissbacteria bacterium RIFCSPLOWO2_02_41_11]